MGEILTFEEKTYASLSRKTTIHCPRRTIQAAKRQM
jgi:hypothetical protein